MHFSKLILATFTKHIKAALQIDNCTFFASGSSHQFRCKTEILFRINSSSFEIRDNTQPEQARHQLAEEVHQFKNRNSEEKRKWLR
ncbi:unnamed protein product [Oikopleura dioica]|uniref:Uncharacterized protein n=1 Tax=Oikopleura dioica TaxID=34765 RepID=E4YAP2_OIKDI|nr:unnamed protein product [Oikopleura dioica]